MTASVLFIAEQGDSTCAYYRAHIPALGLRRAGLEVNVMHTLYQTDDGRLTGARLEGRTAYVLQNVPEVVICRRMTLPDGSSFPAAGMFRTARERGQLVFVDVDDDPFSVPEWNPAFATMTPSMMASWIADMQAATGVICSTPAIARSITWNVPGVRTFVCRNGVDYRAYDPFDSRKTVHEPFRLAWVGTTDFRGRDLETIREPLVKFLNDHPDDVTLWHVGYRAELPGIESIIGPVPDLVEIPYVPIVDLPKTLKYVDSAVIPMVRHRFNQGRSNVLGLALAAAGVPWLAESWNDEYGLLSGASGFVASSVGHYDSSRGAEPYAEWYAGLDTLLHNPASLRRVQRSAAHRQVRQTHSPETTAMQYIGVVAEARAVSNVAVPDDA